MNEFERDVTNSLDRLELSFEREPDFDGDLEDLRDRVLTCLSNVLSFTPDELDIVDPGRIEWTEVGKVKQVYDHR